VTETNVYRWKKKYGEWATEQLKELKATCRKENEASGVQFLT